MRILEHGRILHGMQFFGAGLESRPTAYFGEPSGIGLLLRHHPRRGQLRVGAIGLGVGTLAAYAERGDTLRFYEINPQVVRLARSHFSYLTLSAGRIELVLGDARLSLEREEPQHFDVLVLDAFSGDAVPIHLLTREAFETYLRHLRPDGVIAVHLSNNHLDLVPVLGALGRSFDLTLVGVASTPQADTPWLLFSSWVLMTRNAALLASEPLARAGRRLDPDAQPLRPWTDEHASLFDVVRWR
jgi:spermidine synthase